MRYVSLFSGVEAASVAWGKLGWEPLAFAEIEEFPAAVLACRFPDVPNLGDVCKIDWKDFHERYGTVDVLVGGSPCQSFSIAGNRTGLEGASGLMWQFCRAIRELVEASGGGGPRYVLWENVPGALSSGPKGQKGEDFGCLLRELEKCGYGLAWRVLDSQFARVPDGSAHGFAGPVPQRRRRVFLVGSLGTDGAGDILFERTCLRGDHPKGREAREALARDSTQGSGMGDSAGFKYHQGSQARGIGYERDQSPTLTADYHQPAIMLRGDTTPKFSEDVGITLRVGGDGGTHDAIVLQSDGSSSNGSQNGCGYNDDGSAYTLNGRDKQAVCIQGNAIGRNNGAGGIGVRSDGAAYTVDTKGEHAVAFAQNTRDEVRLFGGDGQTVGALSAQPGMKQTSYVCIQDGQMKDTVEDDLSTTLNASHEQPILAVDCRNIRVGDVSGTLQAKPNGGYSLNYQNPVIVEGDGI